MTLCDLSLTSRETETQRLARLSSESVVSCSLTQFLFHDSGLRQGPRLERVLRCRHTVRLLAGRGGKVPGDGRQEVLSQARIAGEKLSGCAQHRSSGLGKETLQESQVGSPGSHHTLGSASLRVEPRPGPLLSLCSNTFAHPLCEVGSGEERNLFSFFGTGRHSPCREKKEGNRDLSWGL